MQAVLIQYSLTHATLQIIPFGIRTHLIVLSLLYLAFETSSRLLPVTPFEKCDPLFISRVHKRVGQVRWEKGKVKY